MTVIEEIAAERRRQIEEEGWTAEHDDQHEDGSLGDAAACYVYPKPIMHKRLDYIYSGRGETDVGIIYSVPVHWPSSWHPRWWKPKDRRRDLIRAAALIVAEIERLDRTFPTPDASSPAQEGGER